MNNVKEDNNLIQLHIANGNLQNIVKSVTNISTKIKKIKASMKYAEQGEMDIIVMVNEEDIYKIIELKRDIGLELLRKSEGSNIDFEPVVVNDNKVYEEYSGKEIYSCEQ